MFFTWLSKKAFLFGGLKAILPEYWFQGMDMELWGMIYWDKAFGVGWQVGKVQ